MEAKNESMVKNLSQALEMEFQLRADLSTRTEESGRLQHQLEELGHSFTSLESKKVALEQVRRHGRMIANQRMFDILYRPNTI